MEWSLLIDGERETFETRDDVLERLRELLEDHLATSPLAEVEVYDPFGNELEVEVGLRLLVPGEEEEED
ncbi:MAG: hypothetical protein ABIO70_08805 [Pseudomonadota bacterium]